MSLPAKTSLGLPLKLKNGYPAMGGGEDPRFYTIFDPGYVDTVKDRPILTGEPLNLSYYNNVVDNANAVMVTASDASGVVQLGADGLTINLTGYTGTLNGSPIVSGTTQITTGIVNTFALTASVDTNLRYIATDLTNNSSAIIFNVSGPNFDIPLDTDSLTIAREALNADGEELVVNGDFSDGTTGWDDISETGGTFSVINEEAVIEYVTGRPFFCNDVAIPTEAGEVYKISFDVSGSGCNYRGGLGKKTNNLIGDVAVDVGRTEFLYTATATSLFLSLYKPSAGVSTIDNISIVKTTDALYVDVQPEDKVQELP